MEDRSAGGAAYQSTPDGYYRVRRGDSLYAIAFRYGLDWRELARWNRIESPYVIHPDQLLRLGAGDGAATRTGQAAAANGSTGVTTRAAPGASAATTRALDTPRASTVPAEQEPAAATVASGQPEPRASTVPAGEPAAASPPPAPPPSAPVAAPSVPGSDPARWAWPAEGRLLTRFQSGDPSRKGIDIAGEVGQPVRAAAPGVVVYSGSGLIGYGELIIIKHSDRMLSAYAHNSKRLVSEGQQVAEGAQVAEMGTNDRNQSVLHFEIRVNGSPEDPLKYLPSR